MAESISEGIEMGHEEMNGSRSGNTTEHLKRTHLYPRRNRKPPSKYVPSGTSAYMAATSDHVEIMTMGDPTVSGTLKATFNEPELWKKTIEDEFDSIEEIDTWEQAPDSSAKLLPNHIILKVKTDPHNQVERFKDRIVANGNHKRFGKD